MTASVGFKMIEFEEHKHQTIEYNFQVDETSDPDKQAYDVIIGNDLLWNLGIYILFRGEEIQWENNKIPLKTIGAVRDKEYVKCYIVCIRIACFFKKQKNVKTRC